MSSVLVFRVEGNKITGVKVGGEGSWKSVEVSIEDAERVCELLKHAKREKSTAGEFETITRAVRRLYPKATNPKAFRKAKIKVIREKKLKGQRKIEELLGKGYSPERVVEALGLSGRFIRTVRSILEVLELEKEEKKKKLWTEKEVKEYLEVRLHELEEERKSLLLPFNYREMLISPRLKNKVFCARERRLTSFKECKGCKHRVAEEDEFVICMP